MTHVPRTQDSQFEHDRAKETPARRKITAVRILVAGAIGLLLYVGHVAFIPVALASLLALVLSGPVELLHRKMRVPRGAAALLIMLAIGAGAAGLSDMLVEPAQHWLEEAPHTMRVIGRKLRPLAQLVTRIDDLRNSADNLAATTRSTTSAAPSIGASGESAPALLLAATRGVLLSTLTVVILTVFLLAGGPPMLARMTSALVSDLNSAHVTAVIEQVRAEVGRFYATTALINAGLGLATGCAMMWCGMPNPFLWGTVAAVFNFIPYAGPTATLLLVTSVAFVSFDGTAHIAAVAGSFLAIAAIEGQIVQPLLVGRRLKLNPMLVFLALWFGGLFWGIAGVVLATPALAALKVIAENSAHGRQLVDFLSPQSGAVPAGAVAADAVPARDRPAARDRPQSPARMRAPASARPAISNTEAASKSAPAAALPS
jgi:predicted PurR-regulated permease PerM